MLQGSRARSSEEARHFVGDLHHDPVGTKPGIIRADAPIQPYRCAIANLVEMQPAPFQAPARALADERCVLADAAAERDGVRAA